MSEEDNKDHLKNVHKSLVFIANKLSSLKVRWVLGASGALMVHGIDIVPWDLDIFTDEKIVHLLAKEFKKYIIHPLHFFDKDNQKELEFQMKINDIEIEVCEPCNFSHLQLVKFKNVFIPVNSLESELKFYRQRPGKERVVKLIEKKLSHLKFHTQRS